MGAKPKKKLTQIQRLAKAIEMDTKKKPRKASITREVLRDLRLMRQRVEIRDLPHVSPASEEYPYAYHFNTDKRGWLLHVGIGSATIMQEEWDEEGKKRKFHTVTISLASSVYPLRTKKRKKKC